MRAESASPGLPAAAGPHPEVAEVLAQHGPTPRLLAIISETAREFDLTLAELLGHRRPLRLALPRQAAMGLCRELTRHSLPRIAQAFDRDHTTIMHGVRRHAARMADGAYAARIAALRARLTRETTEHDA